MRMSISPPTIRSAVRRPHSQMSSSSTLRAFRVFACGSARTPTGRPVEARRVFTALLQLSGGAALARSGRNILPVRLIPPIRVN